MPWWWLVRCNLKPRIMWGWAFYLVVVIGFLEATLQIFYWVTTGSYLYDRDKPAIYAADPISGWTNAPRLSFRHYTPEFTADIYTNGQGFRVSRQHEEYGREAEPGTFRILLLGPSFAFGWGVNFEYTFGSQLQQRLAHARFANGSTIEVLNHGVPSLPPANGLEWFRHTGKTYGPDLVIQFIYGSFEVSSTPDTSTIVENGHLIEEPLGSKQRTWAYIKHSATVFYSGIILGSLSKAMYEKDRDGKIHGAGRDMRNLQAFSPEDNHVKESMRFYRALKDAVSHNGTDLLIVHFPLSYVVHPEDRARWMLQGVEHIGLQIASNQAFGAYLSALGIQCLDLTEELIETVKEDRTRLYYWLDIHWTERGNMVAAQAVARYLTDREHLYRKRHQKLMYKLSDHLSKTFTRSSAGES
jgi:hypothetical protein